MRKIALVLMFVGMAPLASANDGPVDAATLVPNMKAGKLICDEPNTRTKTCNALTRFEVLSETRFVGHTTMRLDDAATILIVAPSATEIRNGRACAVDMAKDFEKMTFVVNGTAGNDQQNKMMRDKIRPQFSQIFNKEVCEGFARKNGKLTSTGYFDGQAAPETEGEIIWVTKSDGYQVGPK
jgi:hypothetical protein